MTALARLLAALALALAPLPAAAQGAVAPDDARAVRQVIEAQLDAFRQDDAPRAFSYAAPSIREAFQTPENFLAMVRSAYPVVYRPAGVTFLIPLRADADLVQGVHLTDGAGALWLATYRLERQPDGTWRIAGCGLQPANGTVI